MLSVSTNKGTLMKVWFDLLSFSLLLAHFWGILRSWLISWCSALTQRYLLQSRKP